MGKQKKELPFAAPFFYGINEGPGIGYRTN
jgi:hypothetical protein